MSNNEKAWSARAKFSLLLKHMHTNTSENSKFGYEYVNICLGIKKITNRYVLFLYSPRSAMVAVKQNKSGNLVVPQLACLFNDFGAYRLILKYLYQWY